MLSPIKYLAPYTDSIQWIVDYLGGGEFLPSNFIMDFLASFVCDSSSIFPVEACESVLFLLCGFDEAQLNQTMLETITHHTPAGKKMSNHRNIIDQELHLDRTYHDVVVIFCQF